MLSIFRGVVDRVKALFATSAALELEAEFQARHAERQADLLRLADRYAAEGRHGIAANLRRQAEETSPERPLASVLPALTHLGCGAQTSLLPDESTESPSLATTASARAGADVPSRLMAGSGGRKGNR